MKLTLPSELSIIGCGRSIDTLKTPDGFLIGINAGAIIHKTHAAVALDVHMMKLFKEKLGPGVLVFNQNSAVAKFPFEVDCSSILRGVSSLTFTVNICAALGVEKIHLYGMDAYLWEYGYSKKAESMGFAGREKELYERAIEATVNLLEKNKMISEWHR